MKHEKIDAVEVCKEFEDVLAPRLKLSVLDRAVYLHLLRHSRFEGKLRLRFTILWLANNMGVTPRRVRQAVRRLVDNNVLRLIERSNIGHLVQVRLPGEVRAPRGSRTGTGGRDKPPGRVNLDEVDFLRTPPLRHAIHAREGGKCFYCRRRIPIRSRCLDHVVPRAKSGLNSTATWFPAARNAIGKKGITPRPIFCASSTATAACRPRTSAEACGNCRRSRRASSGPRFRLARTQGVSDLG